MKRPKLTPEQAAEFTANEVLRYVGQAGAERVDPWRPKPLNVGGLTPDYIVGQDGIGSLQTAVNHALGHQGRVVIGILPGQYGGLTYVPEGAPPITVTGLGRGPRGTILCDSIDAEMSGDEYATRFGHGFSDAPPVVMDRFRANAARLTLGTANAAVLRIESDDFRMLNLTVRNAYAADRPQPEVQERNPMGQFITGQHQAVAVHVAGADRVQCHNVVMRSFQDTLYLQSPRKGATARTFLSECEIEGDVDFIFGQSTAFFERCTLRSLGGRAAQSWVTAPSTDLRTRFGFVFQGCTFVHDGSPLARAGGMCLGRQWFEGVRLTPFGTGNRCRLGETSQYAPPTGTISRATLDSVGKCVLLDCTVGRHIRAGAPWDCWGGQAGGPRFRPPLFTAADMLDPLAQWLRQQGVSYADIDPASVFLAEFNTTLGE